MDETLENTLLCGVKLSRSIAWGDFQDVLTLDTEDAASMQDSGKLLCGVKFNGQNIGQFYFEGCGSPDAVTANTPIIQIKIDSENNVSSDVPVITVNGLTLCTDIIKKLTQLRELY